MKKRKLPSRRFKGGKKKKTVAKKNNKATVKRKPRKTIRSKMRKPLKKSINTDIKQYTNPIDLNSEIGQHLLMMNEKSLSIILSAHNEESTIEPILKAALQLNPKEVIVIENGSTDQTREICYSYPIRCYSYPYRLGHDVGRAIGAKKASGEVLLFIDGDILIDPSLLLAFVKPCYEGVDMTLNNVDPLYEKATNLDYASMAKNYLNRLLLRPDLGFCSLTAIPHAMTKKAVNEIGVENLAVPPKAQAIAIHQRLKVEKSVTVNVFNSNKIRKYINEVGKLILGDHIEAISWLQGKTSARVYFPDNFRLRSVLKPKRGKGGTKD